MSHTPGPWNWFVNLTGNNFGLAGNRAEVMRFRRWGMDAAAPAFYDREKRIFVHGKDLLVPIPGREHHEWARTLVHPDALLIAAAPELLDALETCMEALTLATTPLPEDREELNAARSLAMKAIAKAKGKP